MESISDDEEANVRDRYTKNPLILEQFEAQIYSIVRQNLPSKDKVTQDPSVMLKTLQLTYHFLVLPICRDPEIVGKIVD